MPHCSLQSAIVALADVGYKTYPNNSCALNQTYRETIGVRPKIEIKATAKSCLGR
jgi:hypothetical protein